MKHFNREYCIGGRMTLDVVSLDKANELMQYRNLSYLAVSFGFYKTLFSASKTSISSRIHLIELAEMSLIDGLIFFGLVWILILNAPIYR